MTVPESLRALRADDLLKEFESLMSVASTPSGHSPMLHRGSSGSAALQPGASHPLSPKLSRAASQLPPGVPQSPMAHAGSIALAVSHPGASVGSIRRAPEQLMSKTAPRSDQDQASPHERVLCGMGSQAEQLTVPD